MFGHAQGKRFTVNKKPGKFLGHRMETLPMFQSLNISEKMGDLREFLVEFSSARPPGFVDTLSTICRENLAYLL